MQILPINIAIMNKKNLFFLISALFLLLQGTHANVHESDYAWRLDSIIYDYPVLPGADSSLVEQGYVRYTYGEQSVEILNAQIFRYHDTTFIFSPTKTLYTRCDSGLYIKEDMRSIRPYELAFDSLEYFNYRTRSKTLYMQNDYRNVYDDEGHLLRTILNYDYIKYGYETDEQGNRTWYEDMRFTCRANDTSALEQTFTYNYDADSAWVPTLTKSVYSRYTDHRLTYKEDKNTTTLHPNGKPAKHELNYTRYNRLGIQTQAGQLSESWNEAGDSLSYQLTVNYFEAGVQQYTTTTTRTFTYDSSGVLTGKTYRIFTRPSFNDMEGKYANDTVFDINYTYTYDSLGALTSLTRYENDYYVGSQVNNFRTYYSHWDGAQWLIDSDYRWDLHDKPEGGKVSELVYEHHYGTTNESHHLIERDSLYRITLDYDTTYNTATGTGSCNRKEYKNGELVLERKRQAAPTWGGWVTTYEKVRYDNYTEITNINDGNIRDGARDTLRWTDRNYHNGFDKFEKSERFNRQTRQWDLLYCYLTRTSFDDNGTPLSAIKYSSNDGGLTWRASESYVFIYDAEKQCYARTFVGYMGIDSNGFPYVTRYQYVSQEFFHKDGTDVGYLQQYYSGNTNGSYSTYEYDEQGRKAHSNSYTYNDATKTWELYGREDYIYYPEPGCRITPITVYNRLDSAGNWYVYTISGIYSATRTFDISDDHGVLLEKHNYTWRDSALVCDTLIYCRTAYNELGQLTDRIIHGYGAGQRHNNPTQKVHYFYYPDGTRYLCQTVLTCQGGNTWANKATLNNNGLGYLRTDDSGRTIETVYYSADSTGLVLSCKERHLFYYADNEADWLTDEHYTWDAEADEWLCAGVKSRGSGNNSYEMNEQGDLVHREQYTTTRTCEGEAEDMESWHMTYGTALSDYPVLQPASYGVPDEKNMFDILNGHSPASRLLTAHHTRNGRRWAENYMAHFYYTPLRQDVDSARTELEKDVEVKPEDNAVTFTWPAISGGASYTLIIWADEARTEKVCTLYLAANGTLLEINFSKTPRRAPAAQWAVPVLSTTIENLSAHTRYWFTLNAYDEAGLLIDSVLGSFATTGIEDAIESVNTNENQSTTHKFIRNGQLYIRNGENTYTITGIVTPLQ